jgi:hypothetical protein
MTSLTSRAEVESRFKSSYFHFKRKMSLIKTLLYRATEPAQRVFYPALSTAQFACCAVLCPSTSMNRMPRRHGSISAAWLASGQRWFSMCCTLPFPSSSVKPELQ